MGRQRIGPSDLSLRVPDKSDNRTSLLTQKPASDEIQTRARAKGHRVKVVLTDLLVQELLLLAAGERPAAVGTPHAVGVAVAAAEPLAIIVAYDTEHGERTVGIHDGLHPH